MSDTIRPDDVVTETGVQAKLDYSPGYDVKPDKLIPVVGYRDSTHNANASTDPFGLINPDINNKKTMEDVDDLYPEAWEFYTKSGTPFSYTLDNAKTLVKAVNFWLYMNQSKLYIDPVTGKYKSQAGGLSNVSYNADGQYFDYDADKAFVETTQKSYSEILSEHQYPPANYTQAHQTPVIRDENGNRVDQYGNPVEEYEPLLPNSERVIGQHLLDTNQHDLYNLLSPEQRAMTEFEAANSNPKTEYDWGGAYSIRGSRGF